MTTTEKPTSIEDVAADEFVDPATPGLGPFGKTGTVMLFVLLAGTGTVMKLIGLIPGVVVGIAGAVFLFVCCIKDHEGYTRLDKWGTKRWHAQQKARGLDFSVAGPLSQLGHFPLPGLLADTNLTQQRDVKHTAYGMVETPVSGHHAISFRAHPDGASLIADDDLLRRVNQWGKALRFLTNEDGCVQAVVTIQTRPDPGDAEADRIKGSITAAASPFATTVLTQIADRTPAGAAIVESFVTLTFESERAGKKRNAEVMAADLAARLPEILARTTAGGAGHCTLMDGQDITETIRAAYDPGCAASIAKCRAEGMPVLMRWDSIGPPATHKHWDYYQHASAISVTWTMTDIEGAVNVTSLEPLIRPHKDIDVTRVSIVYRLRSPGEKTRIARKDHKNAKFHTAKEEPTEADVKREASASVNAKAVARAAGLVDIAVIVTASVTRKIETDSEGVQRIIPALDRVPAMIAAIDQCAPQAMLLLHRQDGLHAPTFAAGLPCIGLVPSAHSTVNTALRDET